MWGALHFVINSLATSVARLRLHRSTVCRLFWRLAEIQSHNVLGLFRHGAGIEPDKGKGISSPGTYEASLMWPCNDGERQWNTMSIEVSLKQIVAKRREKTSLPGRWRW